MKVLILLLSSHQQIFVEQTMTMKKLFNELIDIHNLNDVFSVYDYIGSYKDHENDSTYLDGTTIYCKENDDYNSLYVKTIDALKYIDENIEYDYIFRTNNSTFINIKLLYEYLKCTYDVYSKGIRLNGAPLLRSFDSWTPNCGDLIMQGKGMILNKDTVKYLINNIFEYNYSYNKITNDGYLYDRNNNVFIHGTDDVIISNVINKYHINNRENYTDFMHTYLHLPELNANDENTWNYDIMKQYVTITLKNTTLTEAPFDEKIELLRNLFINKTDDDLSNEIQKSLEYDIMPTIFNGLPGCNFFEQLDRTKYHNYNDRHRIAIICTHKNHIKIAPFVIDYWSRFVTHAYVFDNGSTDGSLENFSKYDWITVVDFSNVTGGKLNDIVNANIKNSMWQNIKHLYDYVIICDFDECPYCENWNNILTKMDNLKAALLYPKHCNMIDTELKPHTEGRLYHELNPYCENLNLKGIKHVRRVNRCYIINPKLVQKTNYLPGQEECYPVADNMTPYYVDNIKMFHLHYIGKEYGTKVNEGNMNDLDENNKKLGYGFHLFNKSASDTINELMNDKIRYDEIEYPNYKNY